MVGHDADLNFPACCADCPYRDRQTGACTHEFRRALVQELGTDRTCSVYRQQKTATMRALAASQ